MKKTLFLVVLMLIWTGSVYAGELKVQIPVEDYTKIETRLKALEIENSRLKQEVRTLESSSVASPSQTTDNGQDSAELKSRLSALESENIRLNQKIKSYKDSGVRALDYDRRTARQVFRDMATK